MLDKGIVMEDGDLIKRNNFIKTYYDKSIRRIKAKVGKLAKVPQHPSELFGCSMEELASHIETKFTDQSQPDHMMRWKYYGDWHVDHVVPMSQFQNLGDVLEQMRCFNFRNLQPLWASQNRAKGKHTIETICDLGIQQCLESKHGRNGKEHYDGFSVSELCTECGVEKPKVDVFKCHICGKGICKTCPGEMKPCTSCIREIQQYICSEECYDVCRLLERDSFD